MSSIREIAYSMNEQSHPIAIGGVALVIGSVALVIIFTRPLPTTGLVLFEGVVSGSILMIALSVVIHRMKEQDPIPEIIDETPVIPHELEVLTRCSEIIENREVDISIEQLQAFMKEFIDLLFNKLWMALIGLEKRTRNKKLGDAPARVAECCKLLQEILADHIDTILSSTPVYLSQLESDYRRLSQDIPLLKAATLTPREPSDNQQENLLNLVRSSIELLSNVFLLTTLALKMHESHRATGIEDHSCPLCSPEMEPFFDNMRQAQTLLNAATFRPAGKNIPIVSSLFSTASQWIARKGVIEDNILESFKEERLDHKNLAKMTPILAKLLTSFLIDGYLCNERFREVVKQMVINHGMVIFQGLNNCLQEPDLPTILTSLKLLIEENATIVEKEHPLTQI